MANVPLNFKRWLHWVTIQEMIWRRKGRFRRQITFGMRSFKRQSFVSWTIHVAHFSTSSRNIHVFSWKGRVVWCCAHGKAADAPTQATNFHSVCLVINKPNPNSWQLSPLWQVWRKDHSRVQEGRDEQFFEEWNGWKQRVPCLPFLCQGTSGQLQGMLCVDVEGPWQQTHSPSPPFPIWLLVVKHCNNRAWNSRNLLENASIAWSKCAAQNLVLVEQVCSRKFSVSGASVQPKIWCWWSKCVAENPKNLGLELKS